MPNIQKFNYFLDGINIFSGSMFPFVSFNKNTSGIAIINPITVQVTACPKPTKIAMYPIMNIKAAAKYLANVVIAANPELLKY